jgi:hypothetical protein
VVLTGNKNIKRGTIARQLAAYFLSLRVGQPIDSVRALAGKYQASIGLISENISALETIGAITIERHGQRGSLLASQNPGLLWKSAVSEPLVIAHTLPSNRRYEGLAGALKRSFSQVGIETYFTFIRGSCTRLKALRAGRCHIAIMSQFAAEGMATALERTATVLPESSFVKSHRVYFRSPAQSNKPGLKAAIDPDSYDQAEISRMEFNGHDMSFEQINFMNIHRYLLDEKVDLAIWTEEDMSSQLSNEIGARALSADTEKTLQKRNSRAALLVQANDEATFQLVTKTVRDKDIVSYQQEVIAGTRIPEY